MNNNFYDIDFGKLVLWLMPNNYRATPLFKWLVAMIKPLQSLYLQFFLYRKETLYYLSITPQVCYLQKLCNDKCDNTLRRILITEVDTVSTIFFWADADARDVNMTNDLYFWPDSMYADSGIDFTVKIPANILTTNSDLAYLKGLVNQHKLAGKNYNIIRY